MKFILVPVRMIPRSEAYKCFLSPSTCNNAQLDSTWKTTINTTTLATTTAYLFIYPRREELLTTMTITTLEPPWATVSLPTTITETIIKQLTYEQRITYLESDLTTTSFTTYTGITVHDTWVIHRPEATDLPAGSRSTDDVPCGEEETCAGGPPDPLCDNGLVAACQGQCQPRPRGDRDNNWYWWCLMIRPREMVYPDLVMGRACWGGNWEYRQLNTPCVRGDAAVPCVPCKGVNESWGALNWHGPVAGDD
ncbi:hypothetical protein GE09DRAFT_742291 [Coniochaeta sp. 2T2.1]|nr:hypothetical protein GE09DRAFT_742291 [Coniochaeta sp. 2T2.1]